ncbi:mandelate racemase/muconate lactonizing enzyme family protein [Pseudactinotalea terrae]|uniref:mandelate racemase/muconate lactonizing enzyme family protein n=1 Tax=Pseudactinotalea terrae TaxID=1743262 RepID=UPI0012E11368|nr:mandelate racemase/muconate lactonizing enzyme family protein [Pseudactinotalea terrae]
MTGSDDSLIADLRTYEVTSRVSRPVADATHEISRIAFLVLEVQTRGGAVGQGYMLSFDYSPEAIKGALRDLQAFVAQRSYHVYDTLSVSRDYEAASEYFGVEGLQRWALATLDVAMWDAWARTLGQPVWKLFGSHGDPIPVYGSGGWLSYSDDELLDEVSGYQRRGFGAIKVKVGSRETGRDLERLRMVRDAVGPHMQIMMDANQGMTVAGAVELATAVREIGIHWFEEPINHRDFDGYATIRDKTQISIATGEREYDVLALRELIARRAIDLWQPDIIRIGGVGPWRASAALAAAHHIPVLPHYYKDYDVPLLATIPNGYGAESFDWVDDLIDEPMLIENGTASPRPGPGWGFSFRRELLNEIP